MPWSRQYTDLVFDCCEQAACRPAKDKHGLNNISYWDLLFSVRTFFFDFREGKGRLTMSICKRQLYLSLPHRVRRLAGFVSATSAIARDDNCDLNMLMPNVEGSYLDFTTATKTVEEGCT